MPGDGPRAPIEPSAPVEPVLLVEIVMVTSGSIGTASLCRTAAPAGQALIR
jgi:hypothetical protein